MVEAFLSGVFVIEAFLSGVFVVSAFLSGVFVVSAFLNGVFGNMINVQSIMGIRFSCHTRKRYGFLVMMINVYNNHFISW